MKEKFYLNTLQSADRIVIPKSSLNLIQHHVIYLGKDKNGNRVYIENAIGKGVQIVSEAYVFRHGYEITRVDRFLGNQQQRNCAIQYAMLLIGKDYNLFDFNCEHYANTIQHGESYSSQVGVGLGFVLLTFIVGLLRYSE